MNSLKIRLVKIAESWSVQSTVSMSCFGRCHDTSTPDFIWSTRQFVEAKLSWRKIKHQRIKLMRLCHQIFPRNILRIQIAPGLSPLHQDSYSITESKPEVLSLEKSDDSVMLKRTLSCGKIFDNPLKWMNPLYWFRQSNIFNRIITK